MFEVFSANYLEYANMVGNEIVAPLMKETVAYVVEKQQNQMFYMNNKVILNCWGKLIIIIPQNEFFLSSNLLKLNQRAIINFAAFT